jgi:FkbM family methyltransferase
MIKMTVLTDVIKQLARAAGYELRRYTVQSSPDAQLARLLANFVVDLVLDVGANEGQYVHKLRAIGYRGRVVSFEPLSSAYASLEAAARSDSLWEVAPRMALGAVETEVSLNISGHSLSSSIHQMLPEHERAAPGSAVVGTEMVTLARLDRIARTYLKDARSVLLKIDTQGYEDRVLAGAAGIMDRITAIQAELSFVPLYAEQPLFDEMRGKIEAMGFDLFAIFPGYVHEVTGRTLQVDGFFLRREALTRKA